jgi:ATP-dependent Clp protease ATP-binding subunit ClpA
VVTNLEAISGGRTPVREIAPSSGDYHRQKSRSSGDAMNGYNFTERVRKCLQLAREEAATLRHEYVGTEHLLLGMCAEGGGVAEAALTNLGVDLEDVRNAILQTVKPGQADGVNDTSPGILSAIASSIGFQDRHDLPYTSRAKKALELAMMEARHLNHSYVGTEHLLLGLLREEKGIAAQVLTSMGMTVAGVREEVVRLLHGEGAKIETKTGTSSKAPIEREAAITLVVEHPDGRIEAKKFKHSGDAVSFLKSLEY